MQHGCGVELAGCGARGQSATHPHAGNCCPLNPPSVVSTPPLGTRGPRHHRTDGQPRCFGCRPQRLSGRPTRAATPHPRVAWWTPRDALRCRDVDGRPTERAASHGPLSVVLATGYMSFCVWRGVGRCRSEWGWVGLGGLRGGLGDAPRPVSRRPRGGGPAVQPPEPTPSATPRRVRRWLAAGASPPAAPPRRNNRCGRRPPLQWWWRRPPPAARARNGHCHQFIHTQARGTTGKRSHPHNASAGRHLRQDNVHRSSSAGRRGSRRASG